MFVPMLKQKVIMTSISFASFASLLINHVVVIRSGGEEASCI